MNMVDFKLIPPKSPDINGFGGFILLNLILVGSVLWHLEIEFLRLHDYALILLISFVASIPIVILISNHSSMMCTNMEYYITVKVVDYYIKSGGEWKIGTGEIADILVKYDIYKKLLVF